MSSKVRIEIMDQFGKWHRHVSISNSASGIKQALHSALKTQLASRSKKVRAVDDKTNSLIDMLQG
tara:strand:+ start:456 stop:650 length:195 start_codon:yes stop_codon:yes gene_type:complete